MVRQPTNLAEAKEIFRQLDTVQGGVAEVKHLRQAV